MVELLPPDAAAAADGGGGGDGGGDGQKSQLVREQKKRGEGLRMEVCPERDEHALETGRGLPVLHSQPVGTLGVEERLEDLERR